MMDKLLQAAKMLALREKEAAIRKHGMFNSPHEAWAVLCEEIYEAEEDMTDIKMLCGRIRDNVFKDIPNDVQLDDLYLEAIHGAAELMQVAAMAQKYKDSRGRWNE